MVAMPLCRESRERSFLTPARSRYRCARGRLTTFFGILALITQVAAWQVPMPGRFLPPQAMADAAVHHDHGSGHPGAPKSGEGHPAHNHELCPICLTLQLIGSTVLPPAPSTPLPVGAGTPHFQSISESQFVS